MPSRHYGCDKFLIATVVLIVLCLLSVWFWGNRAETALLPSIRCRQNPKTPSILRTQQADTKRALLWEDSLWHERSVTAYEWRPRFGSPTDEIADTSERDYSRVCQRARIGKNRDAIQLLWVTSYLATLYCGGPLELKTQGAVVVTKSLDDLAETTKC